nr:fatty acid desaturase [Paracoccaceae bacterium]
MARFAIVTLAMVALLAAGLIWGGLWASAALVYITVFTFFMDRITALTAPDTPAGQEFPAGDGLSITLGIAHFPLLYGGVWALGSGYHLTLLDKVLIFFVLSLFIGQVSNSNAHELIHRAPRAMRRLGVAVYGSILYGQHASAHVRVHHVHAATDRDPNSARLGEHFYAFALRAWKGELIEGYRAESRLRER